LYEILKLSTSISACCLQMLFMDPECFQTLFEQQSAQFQISVGPLQSTSEHILLHLIELACHAKRWRHEREKKKEINACMQE
jgi:hypothetical protein